MQQEDLIKVAEKNPQVVTDGVFWEPMAIRRWREYISQRRRVVCWSFPKRSIMESVDQKSQTGWRKGESNFKHYTASYAPWRDAMRRQGFEMLKQVGFCWMPFGRMSNSSLIPAAVQIEKLLGLRRLYSISPWVVFVAKKLTQ